MHPSKEVLKQYIVAQVTDDSRNKQISHHLEICEFCREFCENYNSLQNSLSGSIPAEETARLQKLSKNLHAAALKGQKIILLPFPSDISQPAYHLAADGVSDEQPQIENIATLYSENPEIVMRLMHDRNSNKDYLELLSEDSALSAFAMVQIPELQLEYITDSDGHAKIDLGTLKNPEKLKWQIKMPNALFSLEPLEYDPNKTEFTKEISMDSEQDDLILVKLEGKTEGKQISISILKLDGKKDFGTVKVIVSQASVTLKGNVEQGRQVPFGFVDPSSTINIRFFK